MSRARRRLAVLSAAGVLCSALFAVDVQAAPAPSHTAAAETIASFAERDAVAHHLNDPRRGSVQVQALVQLRTDSAGALSIRATATLTKVDHAVRVQIDRIRLNSSGLLNDGGLPYPELTALNSTPVNSGAASGVTQSTAWATLYRPPTGRNSDYVSALVEYTTRWSDGTVTRGEFRSNVFQDGNRSERGPITTDIRPVDAAGSTTITHRTRTGTGSVRIDAGIRLYRTTDDPRFAIFGMQPFASIVKKSGATTVQIDSIEALGHPDLDANGRLDDSERSVTTAWPFNAVDRSSGAGSSASLSTAITRVTPRRDGLLSFFEVALYYSVRWSDGTLTTGRYVTPLSALRLSFVGQQDP